MRLLLCSSSPVSEAEFVKFVEYWSRGYSNDPNPDEGYFASLDRLAKLDGTDAKQCLHELFKWKNNRNLSRAKEVFVDRIWSKIESLGGVQAARHVDAKELRNRLLKDQLSCIVL